MNTHRNLFVSATLSLLFLLILVIVKKYHSDALYLPVPWFVISLLPVLLVLITDKYITKLKATPTSIEFETVQPTKPPQESERPPVAENDILPPDYLYLNHTSFLRPECQDQFQELTGVQCLHYDIRVILSSYYHGAIDRVAKVEYILHASYPHPIQVRTRKSDNFLLKEIANGEYVLFAKVYLKDHKDPIVLQRYITLWSEGPRITNS
jgi:hypothetical protein